MDDILFSAFIITTFYKRKLEANFDIPDSQKYLRFSGKPWSVEEIVAIIEKEVI
ncbi:MAG: hypothetical protein K9W44_06135 [Candidatus Lokiarchaeota archaeon]|nr:hypothetical protein [Candidatus Harpocratesius repetitus]